MRGLIAGTIIGLQRWDQIYLGQPLNRKRFGADLVYAAHNL
jgi:hypothetical protein